MQNSYFISVKAKITVLSSILGGMQRLNCNKAISYALVIFMCFLSTLPIIGSISFREPSVSNDVAHTTDMIDVNMSFLMSPEEVFVGINDTFTIQVGIENATDMFGWQVYLHFEPEILECTNVFLPFDHVFSYGITVGGALVEYNSTEFTNPLYRINNDEGRMLAGNCLLGANQSTFNGSGILCQIEFKAISTGSSIIQLCLYSSFDSFILDSMIRAVKSPSTVDCNVTCQES